MYAYMVGIGVLVGILVVLLVIAGYMFFFWTPREDRELERRWMGEMVEMMREAKEEQEKKRQWMEAEEREKKMMEAGLRTIKTPADGGVRSSNHPEKPIKGTRDYIPYGLSGRDQAILDEFYNGD